MDAVALAYALLLASGGAILLMAWFFHHRDPDARLRRRLLPYEEASSGVESGLAAMRGARAKPGAWALLLRGLQAMLERSDLSIRPALFVAIWTALALVGGLVGAVSGSAPWTGAAGSAVGLAAPWLFLRWRRNSRNRKLEQGLADALQLVASAVRAGHTFLQGLELAAREGSPPVSDEFRGVLKAVSLGAGVREALEDLSRRNSNYDIRLAVTAIAIQREVGGNLAELLEGIADTVRERERVRGEVAALTAQGKLSGFVISMIPIGLLAVLNVLNPAYAGVLIATPLGRAMLGASALAWLAGFLTIRKLTRIDY